MKSKYVQSKILWALLGGVVAHLMWSRASGADVLDIGNMLSTLTAVGTGLVALWLIRRYVGGAGQSSSG